MHLDLWTLMEKHLTLATILKMAGLCRAMRAMVTANDLPWETSRLFELQMVHEMVGLWDSVWRRRITHVLVRGIPGIVGLDRMPHLAKLQLHDCRQVRLPPTIEHLELHGTTLEEDTVLSQCKTLSLHQCQNLLFLRDHPPMTQLRNLDLVGTKLEHVHKFQQVQELHLSFHCYVYSRLTPMQQLRKIFIKHVRFSSDGESTFPSFPLLEHLTIERDGKLQVIEHQPRLKTLCARLCSRLQTLANQPMLHRLTVSGAYNLRFLCASKRLYLDHWKPSFTAPHAKVVYLKGGVVSLDLFPAASHVHLSHCTITNIFHQVPRMHLTLVEPVMLCDNILPLPFYRVHVRRKMPGSRLFLENAKHVVVSDSFLSEEMIHSLSTCKNVELIAVRVCAATMLPLLQCDKLILRQVIAPADVLEPVVQSTKTVLYR